MVSGSGSTSPGTLVLILETVFLLETFIVAKTSRLLVTQKVCNFFFFWLILLMFLCSFCLFSQQWGIITIDVTFKWKWFPSSDGTVMNCVHSKAWRKWAVHCHRRHAGTLLKKLLQAHARDHVTQTKIFGIFMLHSTTSNCIIDKRQGRDKGKQLGGNKKQKCSTAHGDHQLFHNKPSYFEGFFKLFFCYSRGCFNKIAL